MTDDNDGPSKAEALEELRNESGQTYITADWAYELLTAFQDEVSDDFTKAHANTHDLPMVALSQALADRQRVVREARGMASCPPHEMIITYADVSGILADALTGEESDYQAVGAGFTADGRHSDNVEMIHHATDATPDSA